MDAPRRESDAGPGHLIRGHVAPGFEPVRDAFAENFRSAGELGAACAVYHRGEPVVDLWGGTRDHHTGAPWERDTLVGLFSVTKAVSAMAVALLHARGLVDFGAPVAQYWPEFAQHGKERITLRQLLTHEAGLSAIDQTLTPELLADHDRLAHILARQRPAWEPGTRHGYHAVSLGFYESELVRRVDPQRRTIGRFVMDELAAPLGVEFYIGAPTSLPEERFAVIKDFHPHELLYRPSGFPPRLLLAILAPWSLPFRSFLNPPVKRPADLFRPPLRHLEIPSGNGIAAPRAVARILSAFARGGAELNIPQRTIDELEAPPRTPPAGDRDVVLKIDCRWGVGGGKPFPAFPFGTSDRAYGAAGLGGAFALADPDTQTAYAYAPTRSGFCLWNDPRERRLREAMFRCIANRG